MECLMEPSATARVQQANLKVRSILSHAHSALTGQQDLTPENIRDISQPLAEMTAIISQAATLRATDANLDASLKEYAQNLAELQCALEQVRFMLLARQAHLEASRCHLGAVDLWATAFQQTR